MRTMIRFLTITGFVATSASAMIAQNPRSPARPIPPLTREQQLEIGERILELREAILRQNGAARPGARAGLGAGGRAGMRAGAGMRGRMGAGMRGRMGPGMRAGGRGLMREPGIERRAIARERYAALQPAQREALFRYRESARNERFRVGEQVRAGTLTREQARERLTKWREANKPPVDLKAPRRPGRPGGGN